MLDEEETTSDTESHGLELEWLKREGEFKEAFRRKDYRSLAKLLTYAWQEGEREAASVHWSIYLLPALFSTIWVILTLLGQATVAWVILIVSLLVISLILLPPRMRRGMAAKRKLQELRSGETGSELETPRQRDEG